MKILILMSLMSIALACRSKHKIISEYKGNIKENQNLKVDSSGLQSSRFIHAESTGQLLQEKKNELSGNLSIKGKSDASNPFIFHNVIGNDTIQSISIIGNAEYVISNHYAKADNTKSHVVKKEFTNIIQDSAQKTISKKISNEVTSEVKQQTKEIKAKGFQAGSWIVITIVMVFLIFIYFTYKYFKK